MVKQMIVHFTQNAGMIAWDSSEIHISLIAIRQSVVPRKAACAVKREAVIQVDSTVPVTVYILGFVGVNARGGFVSESVGHCPIPNCKQNIDRRPFESARVPVAQTALEAMCDAAFQIGIALRDG